MESAERELGLAKQLASDPEAARLQAKYAERRPYLADLREDGWLT
jgi:hypothetical protein